MQEETILYSLDNANTPKAKRAIYRDVQVQLQNKGIEFGVDSIINKWKKLKQQYKAAVQRRRRSGTGYSKKKNWKFFEKMDQICGTRANISPPSVLDSSLDNESEALGSNMSDESDLEDKDEDQEDEKPKTDEPVNEPKVQDDENSDKESVVEDVKPKLKHRAVKSVKKTKLEKSMEILSKGFREASEKETEMLFKIEEMRSKQLMDHEIRLRQLDNECRKEERQHEIQMLSMMAQMKSQQPLHQRGLNYQPSSLYDCTIAQVGRPYAHSQGSSTTTDGDNTYYEL